MLSDILPVIQQITDAANEQPGNGLPAAADGQRYAIGAAIAGADFTPWGTVLGSLGQTLTALAPGEIIEHGAGLWVRQLALGAQHVDVSVPQIGGAQLRWSGVAFVVELPGAVNPDPEALSLTGPQQLDLQRRFYEITPTAGTGQVVSASQAGWALIYNRATDQPLQVANGTIRPRRARMVNFDAAGDGTIWSLR